MLLFAWISLYVYIIYIIVISNKQRNKYSKKQIAQALHSVNSALSGTDKKYMLALGYYTYP